jgi:uncharacterized protein (TIGR03643 family)
MEDRRHFEIHIQFGLKEQEVIDLMQPDKPSSWMWRARVQGRKTNTKTVTSPRDV